MANMVWGWLEVGWSLRDNGTLQIECNTHHRRTELAPCLLVIWYPQMHSGHEEDRTYGVMAGGRFRAIAAMHQGYVVSCRSGRYPVPFPVVARLLRIQRPHIHSMFCVLQYQAVHPRAEAHVVTLPGPIWPNTSCAILCA